MNVLVLPLMYTSKKFTGISMVNFLMDVIKIVNDHSQLNVNWWFGVPTSPTPIQWSEKDFSSLKNVKTLEILASDGMDRAKSDGFCGIDHPFFAPSAMKLFSKPSFLMFDVILI